MLHGCSSKHAPVHLPRAECVFRTGARWCADFRRSHCSSRKKRHPCGPRSGHSRFEVMEVEVWVRVCPPCPDRPSAV